jgi:uncharacterized membrane protein YkvA (DUF1232 family)
VSGGIVAAALAVWFARAGIVHSYEPIASSLGVGSWWLAALGVVVVGWLVGVGALILLGRDERARAVAGFIPDCIVLVGRLLRDPRVPRHQKLVLVVLAAYLALPIDLIPDVIPVLGELDEAILVALVLRWITRSAGLSLLREHWPGPASSLRVVSRLAVA